MGINIKSDNEIIKMKHAGDLAALVLDFIEPYIKPGVNTLKINDLCDEFINKHNAIAAPLNYRGFPKSICSSINDVVCHGIPNDTDVLKDGDIVNIDITVILNGYHGDTSKTFLVGSNHSQKALDLVHRTQEALMLALEQVRPGKYFGDIGKSIDNYITPFGYGIVRDLTGHGIGINFHEEPQILHYNADYNGSRMKSGMVFTIEPMINEGGDWRVVFDKNDKWTVRTTDGSLSAQFEHTVLVIDDGCEILTLSKKN